MGKLSTLACTLFCGLSTAISFAGNKAEVIIPGLDKSKIPFVMKKGLIEGEDYLSKTIIFKVKSSYRQNCKVNAVDNILEINDFLSYIGVQGLKKIYPNHAPPAQQRNSVGQQLVDLSLIYSFKYSANMPLEKVINQLIKMGYFEYVEPWYVPKVTGVLLNPNDPSWSSNAGQYHLRGTGAVGTGSINAPNAWSIQTGSSSVVVGIVDTGTLPTHADLAANYVGGYDVAMNDNDPTWEGDAHGVAVSGDACAVTNNGVGVASPGFNCKFKAIKVADASGALVAAYTGVTWAADNGCKIINCSWGGGGGGSYGQNIMDYAAINKNCLVVVSAGNGGLDQLVYPSSYNNVYRVAWTTSSDAKSNSSDYGNDVDYASPGSGIYSTYAPTPYGALSGTSMASPVSAGAAAIIQSQFNYTNAFQIGEKLKQTCDPLPSSPQYNAGKLGKGRIDLYNALTVSAKSLAMNPITVTDQNDDAFMQGETLYISGNFINYLDPSTSSATATLSVVSVSSGTAPTLGTSSFNIGVLATLGTNNNNASPFTAIVSPSAPVNQVINFRVRITDGAFTGDQYFSVTVNVDYINIVINDVFTTITSKGRIGYNLDGQAQGLGFEYQLPSPNNLLYEMSLMIGTSSTKVSDMFRETTGGNNDFASTSRAYEVIPANISDFDVDGKFNDAPSASGALPVEVHHCAYAWSTTNHRKFVIVKYVIKNTGGTTLNNLYAGIIADWDITNAGQNKSAYDATNRMGYCYDVSSPSGLYAGIKSLANPSSVKNYCLDNVAGGNSGVDPASDFLTAEKYTVLSTTRNADGFTATGGDVMNCVSNGPFSVNAGDSIVAAFALIGGDNLADIQNSACYAQAKWDNTGPCAVLSATASSTNVSCAGLCNGTATVTAISGTPPYTYSWAPGGATTSSVSGLCAGSYSVTVTDAASATSSTSVTITQPTALSLTSSSASTVCSGSCAAITANATGGSGGNNYSWQPGNLSGASVNVCPTATTGYTATVTDNNGCTSTSVTTITVNPAQSTPVITASGSTTICQGNDVTLSSSTGNSYSWSTGATTQDIAVSSSGNYSVTVTNTSGCSASSAVTNVTVVPSPTVTITTNGVFCQGNSITLSSNTQTSYSWSTGATTQSIVVSAGGSYSLVVTNFCGNDSSSAIVMLNPLPTVSVLINPDTTCVNAGAFTLTGGTPAGGAYSGNGVSGGNFDPASAGGGLHNIIYSYTDGNNCTNSDTAQIYVDLCTGVQTSSNDPSFSISPNPSNGIIKVKCSESISSIEVVNIIGETIFSSTMNSLQIEINLSKEPSGIYFIHFISNINGPSIFTRKFSISK